MACGVVESEILVGRSVAVAALMTGSRDEEGAAGGSHAVREGGRLLHRQDSKPCEHVGDLVRVARVV